MYSKYFTAGVWTYHLSTLHCTVCAYVYGSVVAVVIVCACVRVEHVKSLIQLPSGCTYVCIRGGEGRREGRGEEGRGGEGRGGEGRGGKLAAIHILRDSTYIYIYRHDIRTTHSQLCCDRQWWCDRHLFHLCSSCTSTACTSVVRRTISLLPWLHL